MLSSRLKKIFSELTVNILYRRGLCHKVTLVDSRIKILTSSLDISRQKAHSILQRAQRLADINPNRLSQVITSLINQGYSIRDIVENARILNILPNSIEQHTLFLQEAGVSDLKTDYLLRFSPLVHGRISLLKAYKILSDDAVVTKNYFHCWKSEDYDSDLFSAITDENSINEAWQFVLKHLLAEKLRVDLNTIETFMENCKRLQYKSLRLMNEMLDILLKEVQMTPEKIIQNPFLIYTHPRNLRRTLDEIPLLSKLDIRNVIKSHPKIAAVSPDQINKTLSYIKEFGISEECVEKDLQIFTLSPESVLLRLKELKNVPQFEALRDNPRALRLVLYQHKAAARLDYLRQINVKNASLHVLSATDSIFERYAREGVDKTKGSDTVTFLGTELDVDRRTLRKTLSANKFWCQVPLLQVQDTLNHLLGSGFDKEIIKQLPVILLYPKNQINYGMECVQADPEAMHVKGVQRLTLCLYFIEKQFHFTGNGIWPSHSDSASDLDAQNTQLE